MTTTAQSAPPIRDLPEADIQGEIERLQGIQKANPPTSQEWRNASAQLRPLFEEMARRNPR